MALPPNYDELVSTLRKISKLLAIGDFAELIALQKQIDGLLARIEETKNGN